MGRYDFTRFTHLGHRRLFRRFEEVESGAVGGPAMALGWSVMYFTLSFTRRPWRWPLTALVRLAFFWLPFIDHLLINRPGTLDAAAGYYFLGAKSNSTLSDRELITLYRGAL